MTQTMTTDPATKMQLRLPLSLKTHLDKTATQRGIASSLLIRQAIVAYLELPPKNAVMKPPGDPRAKQQRANDKRKQAMRALKILQKTNPELLAKIAADPTLKGKAG